MFPGASLWIRMLFAPESIISSMWRSSRTVSRSMMISLRSIETTSPVSSSTKSSTQVFSTRAAKRWPTAFFRLALVTLTSSARSNISKISRSLSKPIARSSVVTGNFFLRSMYAYITLLMSVANSIHEPLNGMIRAE